MELFVASEENVAVRVASDVSDAVEEDDEVNVLDTVLDDVSVCVPGGWGVLKTQGQAKTNKKRRKPI